MKSWNANLLICDDLMFSLSGKMTAIGIYTGDIGIPTSEHRTGQLIFMFMLQGDLTEQPTEPMVLEVTFPGEQPHSMTLPPPVFGQNFEGSGRTKWFQRTPFMIQNVILRPGQIKTRIRYGKLELNPGSPWITAQDQVASLGQPLKS